MRAGAQQADQDRPPSAAQRQQIEDMMMMLKNTPAAPISASATQNNCLQRKAGLHHQQPEYRHQQVARRPAAATHSMSRLGRRRLAKLTGTGLPSEQDAPRRTTCLPQAQQRQRNVPNGSIWRSD